MSEALPPPSGGARARLVLLPALAVAWILPWAEVQDRVTGATFVQDGAARTGLAALAALVLLWGWSVSALAARTRAGLRAGEAFSAALLCAVVSVLLLGGHPWLPTGERAQALLPVFGPLALLALLDGALQLAPARDGARPGAGVGAIRVGAGVFSAASLVADEAHAPALLALAASVGPLAFLPGRGGFAARRSIDGLVTLGALGAGFAPTLQRMLVTLPDPLTGLLPSAIAWSVLSALVVLTGASGLFAAAPPEAAAPAAGDLPASPPAAP